MRYFFCSICTVLIVMSVSCSGNSTTSDLEQALSWADTGKFFFDDWNQINQDFGWTKESFLKQDWLPHPIDNYTGNEIPSELLKDNFGQYTGMLLSYAPTGETKQIGFEYPEIRWESRSGVCTMYGLLNSYDKSALEKFTTDLGYSKETYRGYVVYSRKIDLDLFDQKHALWATLFGGFGYDDEDKILILASGGSNIKAAIDTHLDKKSLLQAGGMDDVASNFATAESVFIINGCVDLNAYMRQVRVGNDSARIVDGLGLTIDQLRELHSPSIISIGEMKGGQAMSVLQFSSSSEATSELPLRMKMLTDGRSMVNFVKLKDEFLLPNGETSGDEVILKWSQPCYLNETSNHVVNGDFAWLMGGYK